MICWFYWTILSVLYKTGLLIFFKSLIFHFFKLVWWVFQMFEFQFIRLCYNCCNLWDVPFNFFRLGFWEKFPWFVSSDSATEILRIIWFHFIRLGFWDILNFLFNSIEIVFILSDSAAALSETFFFFHFVALGFRYFYNIHVYFMKLNCWDFQMYKYHFIKLGYKETSIFFGPVSMKLWNKIFQIFYFYFIRLFCGDLWWYFFILFQKTRLLREWVVQMFEYHLIRLFCWDISIFFTRLGCSDFLKLQT